MGGIVAGRCGWPGMNIVADYLSHNHHIPMRRVPQAWDGLAFWRVTTVDGVYIALAQDEDHAAEGMERYAGMRGQIGEIRGPVQFPLLPLIGWAQYVDCVRITDGDPADPALRAPDSTQALPAALAFLDALGDPSECIGPTGEEWHRWHERRLRELRYETEDCDDPGLAWDGERWSC